MVDKNKQAIEIYDAIAEKYAQTFDAVESEEDMKFPNRFLTHLTPASTILDIGCGTGFTVHFFEKNGMQAQGIDLSKKMIEIAKKNYPAHSFTVADMRIFHADVAADAVWAGYSLFHFEQPSFEQTIETIKRYLKPKGVLGIIVQEGSGGIEKQEPFLPEKNIYIHLYTEQELKKILMKHGFEIVDQDRKKAKEYEFPFDKLLVIARLK